VPASANGGFSAAPLSDAGRHQIRCGFRRAAKQRAALPEIFNPTMKLIRGWAVFNAPMELTRGGPVFGALLASGSEGGSERLCHSDVKLYSFIPNFFNFFVALCSEWVL
jgi:hypothetical protein